MSSYIGLAALKEALGLKADADDTVDDGVLTSLIYRASALVDNYLDAIRPGWVGIASGSNTRGTVGSNTRRYDGTGTDTLFIDDASSISSVVVDDVTIESTAYEPWPYNTSPKRALIYSEPASSLRGLYAAQWAPGTANVDVTGYFGLATIPDDIAQVALSLCILLWRRYQSGDPAPVVLNRPGGKSGDAEIDDTLAALWPRWGVPWVGGA